MVVVTAALAFISLFIGQYGMSFTDTIKSVFGISDGVEAENIQKIIVIIVQNISFSGKKHNYTNTHLYNRSINIKLT